MGKHGLLTLASIVGTDLRHPLLHVLHVLHLKQGPNLEAVKDYGDQVWQWDWCNSARFSHAISDYGWPLSIWLDELVGEHAGAAAETWNCTVNQERGEEGNWVRHELTEQLTCTYYYWAAYLYLMSMLSWYAAKTHLNSCLVAHWRHDPWMTVGAFAADIGGVFDNMSVSTFRPWLKQIPHLLPPFGKHFYDFLCSKWYKLSKCYKSLARKLWSSCLKSFVNPFCQKQPGHVQLECNGSLSTTKAARCCKGGWTHPALVHEPSPLQSEYDIIFILEGSPNCRKYNKPGFSLILFDIRVRMKGHMFAKKLFVYLLCCATEFPWCWYSVLCHQCHPPSRSKADFCSLTSQR